MLRYINQHWHRPVLLREYSRKIHEEEAPFESYLEFLGSKKNLKTSLSQVRKMYRVYALLTNARTCFYEIKTSQFFNIDPRTLEEYVMLG